MLLLPPRKISVCTRKSSSDQGRQAQIALQNKNPNRSVVSVIQKEVGKASKFAVTSSGAGFSVAHKGESYEVAYGKCTSYEFLCPSFCLAGISLLAEISKGYVRLIFHYLVRSGL